MHFGIPPHRCIIAAAFARCPIQNGCTPWCFEGPGADGKVNVYDSCSYPMFRQWREVVKDQAESVAISYADRIDLTYGSDQDMEKAYRQYVSGWMFPTFGLRPALGGCSMRTTI